MENHKKLVKYTPRPLPPEAAAAAGSAAALAASAAERLRRDRQAMWDAENIITASCRLTASEDARLRHACQAAGITRYQLLRFMIARYLDAVEGVT